MLYKTIKLQKEAWLNSTECTIKEIVQYIRKKGKLRDTQIEAIEVYLFLKVQGENRPLWKLFIDGFFIDDKGFDSFEKLLFEKGDIKKLALYNFSKIELPSLKQTIIDDKIDDYDAIVKKIFYGVTYSDYLLSLPMGAGKTYLMAAFIYLDLYFALNEPDNKSFAHNFLILIPSGLKNSISPSLKSIENFDGSWVVEETQANKIKKLLKFDILDVAKTAKKSNLAVNPNAAKVNSILPNPFGQIFVVNAEKVILNSKSSGLFEDEEITQNELKQKLALIPNLSILIDEVHHAASDDIKLRQVVSWWSQKGNVTTVLGFSGTPYLKSDEKIYINNKDFFKFKHITNTVYYYPLTTAIQKFLKRPTVKSAKLEKKEILTQAIHDFEQLYKDKIYEDGTIAKCAIYCSNIKDLEEVVYPHLVSKLKLNKDEILKFHRGNKEYKIPSSNELEFRSLDLASSKKRYILLVQVGKEGWDCRSLTGVILSGVGDSPKNMVLQTSCRCLREADKHDNTALIWLNEANAKILNEQLKKEQNSSIEEINSLNKIDQENIIKRVSRVDFLQIPKIEFFQLRIKYTTIDSEQDANTKKKLNAIVKNIATYKEKAFIYSGSLNDIHEKTEIKAKEYKKISFEDFLFQISKRSFNQLTLHEINIFKIELQKIYKKCDNLEVLYSDIALCFSRKRELSSVNETIKQEAQILIAANLHELRDNPKLYPSQTAMKQILEADNNPDFIKEFEQKKQKKIIELAQQQKFEEIANISNENLETATKNKDSSFHYLPYDFKQSGFEKDILESFLTRHYDNLEIYYNGERGLTEFVIECFKKQKSSYRYIGKYTTDFLILKRDSTKSISKILILETKGEGFANDEKFLEKKKFVDGEFIAKNNEAFGYKRFGFLYLEDSKSIDENLSNLEKKIMQFFEEH